MNEPTNTIDIDGVFTPVDFRKGPEAPTQRVGEWCQYDDTGRIVCTGYGHLHEVQLMAISGGTNYLFKPAVASEHYIVDGEVVQRETCPYTIVGNVLKGVPAGSRITVDTFTHYEADGTDINLTFSHSGTYLIDVDPFPYKRFQERVVYELGS